MYLLIKRTTYTKWHNPQNIELFNYQFWIRHLGNLHPQNGVDRPTPVLYLAGCSLSHFHRLCPMQHPPLPQCRWISFPSPSSPSPPRNCSQWGFTCPVPPSALFPRPREGGRRRERGKETGKPRAPHSLPATARGGRPLYRSSSPRKGAAAPAARRRLRSRHFFMRFVSSLSSLSQ